MDFEEVKNKPNGKRVVVDGEWVKENDPELFRFIMKSEYCDFKENDAVIEIRFSSGGMVYYACAEWADCEYPSQNQPPWGSDAWEEFGEDYTGILEKYLTMAQ